MRKLIISNIITAAIVFTFFEATNSKSANSKKQEVDEILDQKVNAHLPITNSTKDQYTVQKNKLPLLNNHEKERLYKKFKLNEETWSDVYVKIHPYNVDVNGREVSPSDVYKAFYGKIHNLLEDHYTLDAKERFETYLTLKSEHEAKTQDIYQESYKMEDIANLKFRRQISLIEKRTDISNQEKKTIITELDEDFYYRDHSGSSAPARWAFKEINKIDLVYNANIRKTFGRAYSDINNELVFFNTSIQDEYGNNFQKTYHDENNQLYANGEFKMVEDPNYPVFSFDL